MGPTLIQLTQNKTQAYKSPFVSPAWSPRSVKKGDPTRLNYRMKSQLCYFGIMEIARWCESTYLTKQVFMVSSWDSCLGNPYEMDWNGNPSYTTQKNKNVNFRQVPCYTVTCSSNFKFIIFSASHFIHHPFLKTPPFFLRKFSESHLYWIEWLIAFAANCLFSSSRLPDFPEKSGPRAQLKVGSSNGPNSICRGPKKKEQWNP